MSVDNNDKKDIKNILAFALIVVIAVMIAFFNWSKGFRTSSNKTKEENKSEQEIKSNIQEIKNILDNGIKELKNISNNPGQQENKNDSYGYGYGYGYSNIDYNNLLKNIKPEDIEQYIRDSNDINNTLKKEQQNKTE